jgi:hypothetical protein
VSIALGPGQRVTIRGVARRGAVIDGGRVRLPVVPGFSRRIAGEVERLLKDARLRRRLALNGRRLVDARGVFRVADRLRRLPGASEGIGDVA